MLRPAKSSHKDTGESGGEWQELELMEQGVHVDRGPELGPDELGPDDLLMPHELCSGGCSWLPGWFTV